MEEIKSILLDNKIARWVLDREEQQTEHDLKMGEILKRIDNIKRNGNGGKEKTS